MFSFVFYIGSTHWIPKLKWTFFVFWLPGRFRNPPPLAQHLGPWGRWFLTHMKVSDSICRITTWSQHFLFFLGDYKIWTRSPSRTLRLRAVVELQSLDSATPGDIHRKDRNNGLYVIFKSAVLIFCQSCWQLWHVPKMIHNYMMRMSYFTSWMINTCGKHRQTSGCFDCCYGFATTTCSCRNGVQA